MCHRSGLMRAIIIFATSGYSLADTRRMTIVVYDFSRSVSCSGLVVSIFKCFSGSGFSNFVRFHRSLRTEQFINFLASNDEYARQEWQFFV